MNILARLILTADKASARQAGKDAAQEAAKETGGGGPSATPGAGGGSGGGAPAARAAIEMTRTFREAQLEGLQGLRQVRSFSTLREAAMGFRGGVTGQMTATGLVNTAGSGGVAAGALARGAAAGVPGGAALLGAATNPVVLAAAIGVGVLAVGVTLGRKMIEGARSSLESIVRNADVSPGAAIIAAREQVDDIRRRRAFGDATANSGAFLQRQLSGLRDDLLPIRTLGANLRNFALGAGVSLVRIAKFLSPIYWILRGINALLEKVVGGQRQTAQPIEQLMPALIGAGRPTADRPGSPARRYAPTASLGY